MAIEDYEEEFDVRTEDGVYWDRLHSKMFCGDKAVFSRACSAQLLKLADQIRITGSTMTLTSTMTQREWTIGSIEALRQWTLETGRYPVFDQPRTDPHLLSSDSGFSMILRSHLASADKWSIVVAPLTAALAELQSGASHITVRNVVTNDEQELRTEADLIQWTINHHQQLGIALQEHTS